MDASDGHGMVSRCLPLDSDCERILGFFLAMEEKRFHPVGIVAAIALTLCLGCTRSLEDAHCPCLSGWSCCETQNVCRPLGSFCPGSLDAAADRTEAEIGSQDNAGEWPPSEGIILTDGSRAAVDEILREPDVQPDVKDAAILEVPETDMVFSDVPQADDSAPDMPIVLSDAPVTADASNPGEVPLICPSPTVDCNGQCVDLTSGRCCVAIDCAGSCMICSADHLCNALLGQDDPTKRCSGTCDATGLCKAKKGQPCQSTGNSCVSSTICVDGYCCDKACTGTCEACDVDDAHGTCTTLGAGAQPRTGRTACAGIATCAGACDGASPSCSYPTTACGTASCADSTYQGAGTCNRGTCDMPAPQTCANVCVEPGGCTGECKPTWARCSDTGVPQICDPFGTWQDQAACRSGFTCSTATGICTCPPPNTTCGGECVDLQTDFNNCGSCNHHCQGGTCSAGTCQPVAATVNLVAAPRIFAVDDEYLYYSLPSTTKPQAYVSYRFEKKTTSAMASLVFAGDTMDDFAGVIGSSLFIVDSCQRPFSYTIGSSSDRSPLALTNCFNFLARFTSVKTRYYAQTNDNQATVYTIGWYNLSNSLMARYSETTTGIAPSGGSLLFNLPFAAGDSVYWVRTVYDSSYNTVDSSGLFTTSVGKTTPTQLAGGSYTGKMRILDANEKSVLLSSDSTIYSLYRVPLPAGMGTYEPQYIAILGSINANAVEDASGLYWIDTTGSVYRCAPANCTNTAVVIATGQNDIATLWQDESALYWARSSPNQIIRLAK